MASRLQALLGFVAIGLVVSLLVLQDEWLRAWPWAAAIVLACVLLSLLGEAVVRKVEERDIQD